jgi:hypothetical protein
MAAEGTLEEEKLVLGWLVNTRNLTLSLPKDKFENWTSEINKLLTKKRVKHKNLECLIGHLNHVAEWTCIYYYHSYTPPMKGFQ